MQSRKCSLEANAEDEKSESDNEDDEFASQVVDMSRLKVSGDPEEEKEEDIDSPNASLNESDTDETTA